MFCIFPRTSPKIVVQPISLLFILSLLFTQETSKLQPFSNFLTVTGMVWSPTANIYSSSLFLQFPTSTSSPPFKLPTPMVLSFALVPLHTVVHTTLNILVAHDISGDGFLDRTEFHKFMAIMKGNVAFASGTLDFTFPTLTPFFLVRALTLMFLQRIGSATPRMWLMKFSLERKGLWIYALRPFSNFCVEPLLCFPSGYSLFTLCCIETRF